MAALGYAGGKHFTELSLELYSNLQILLIKSHSMLRILEILEFGSVTGFPILISQVKSWPSGGVPVGHFRTLLIPQIIRDYNEANPGKKISDLDEFNLSKEEKENNSQLDLRKIYAMHTRLAIHYETSLIKTEDCLDFDIVNSESSFKSIPLDPLEMKIKKYQEARNVILKPSSKGYFKTRSKTGW